MADMKINLDPDSDEFRAALLAEVKLDPANVGYVPIASFALPEAAHLETKVAAGTSMEAAMAAFDRANADRNQNPNDKAKADALVVAAAALDSADGDLQAANDVVDTAHRLIDQAGYEIAAKMSAPVTTGETVPIGDVPLEKIVGAFVAADLAKLNDLQTKTLGIYLTGSVVDSASQNVREFLFGAFPDGTPTSANLHAAMDRPATRAEVLFGANVTVNGWDVSRAIQADKAGA